MSKSEEAEHDALTPRVVEVIPVLKGLPKPALTYFYRGPVEVGEFVTIDVRGTPTMALVTHVRGAREARSDVRAGSFALKKLSGKRANLGITRSLAEAADKTAEYYAVTTGAVLGTIIPKMFLTEPELLTFNFPETPRTPREPVLIQLETQERFAAYKSIIRERFAKSESVLVLAPTNELARRAYETLSQGIEDYAHLFTLIEKKKAMRDALKLARAQSHPVLFVTTPAGIIFDRSDLSTIILEAEGSNGYRTRTKPYISFKVLLEFYSRISGKSLIMGDTVLSIETLWKEKLGLYTEFTPLKWRVNASSKSFVIDMKQYKNEAGKFEIFSPELKSLVSTALSDDDQIFLFGARKGLSPTTVCGDCGNLLPCQNCGAPIVLHKKNDTERIYVCHACGAVRPSETKCDTCQSWKLVPLGIGIDRIADEARALWPDVPVYTFDKDHLETPTAARNLSKKISGGGPAIIVGSELFTLYREHIPHAAVVSMDSLFAIPDFSIHERIFGLVTKLREMATHNLLIQTRNIGKDILTQASKGDISSFYRSELADREAFSYPPFSLFIKVSGEFRESEINSEAAMLKSLFTVWNPDFLKIRGKTRDQASIVMIIRLPRREWPDKELRGKLSLLGPQFLVKVDPESIL